MSDSEEPADEAAAEGESSRKRKPKRRTVEDLRLERQLAAYSRTFGKHALSLRAARGLTQEELSSRSGLSPDTIRRLEHGDFSPSLSTLYKLAEGFRLPLSTIFLALEVGQEVDSDLPELIQLLSRVPHVPIRAIIALVEALAEALETDT